MKHPHHEIILAYLNDELVQFYHNNEWVDLQIMSTRLAVSLNFPNFPAVINYRIKPTPKPDHVRYTLICTLNADTFSNSQFNTDNLKLTFDGETLKLKSAELV